MGLRLSEMMLSLSETLPWHPMMIDEREVSREEFTFKDLGVGQCCTTSGSLAAGL